VASHPGYQADEMKELEVDPLFGRDTGGVGWLGSRLQDVEGAATTRDAASAETTRDVSISPGIKKGKERAGLVVG
jgi:hypothetical protein